MDWTTLLKALQSNFIQILNKIQWLAKFTLCILLALIISITVVVIPGVPLTTNQVAEALPVDKSLPPSLVKNRITGWQKASSFLPDGSSFLSDNSFLRVNYAPTFAPTALTFAPSLALFRMNYYLEIKEFSLVKIINEQSSRPTPALEYYKQGVERTQQGDYKNAVKHYSDALSKDGNFAEAYVSRGRAYSELGDEHSKSSDRSRAIEYQQRAIKDYTKALEVKSKFAAIPKQIC